MVRVTLATLGLVDENNPEISSTDFFDSSPLRIRYFSAKWRNLMLYIVKCLGGNQGSHDLVTKLTTRKKGRDQNICYTREVNVDTTADKSLSGTAVQHGPQPKSKTDKKSKKKRNPPSSKPKTSKISRE
ncbi:hypothetical protein Tco_0684229 [Tanacetum coccineum]